MIVYRAMCEEEFKNTIKYGKPDFAKSRFKWFSPSLDFIKERVKDGSFNNSRHCKDRYNRVGVFEYPEINKNKEIQVDRRKNISIKFLKEIEL